ncbi:spermine oxidase, partial [Asbolus verrucosus]
MADGVSVIIIGAGPAGMAAATKLLENSVTNITVIEAESRIGGRVKSVEFGNTFVDEGAEYCDGEEGNVVYEMVKDLDLLEHSHPRTTKLYYSNGSRFNQALEEDLAEIILNYDSVIQEGDITGISLGEAFMNQYKKKIINKYTNDKEKLKIATEGVRLAENFILNQKGAISWYKPSARKHYEACKGDPAMSWKKRGFRIVFDILSKKYPDSSKQLPIDDKIILNKKISTIHWNDAANEVTARASDNTAYTANHIIFTPSLGVLKEEQDTLFKPPLPESKKKAIEAIGFGGVMKVFIHFPKKWWKDDDIFYFLWSNEDLKNAAKEFPHGPNKDGISWVSHILSFAQVETNPNTLIAWVSGDQVPEIEQIPAETVLDGCMYVMNKFLSKDYNITVAGKIIRSQWCSNPNFRGTYSFEKNGYFEEDVSYQTQLAEPLKNRRGLPVVLFAGEATNPKHYTSVHGAIESGRREAKRIIDLYAV